MPIVKPKDKTPQMGHFNHQALVRDNTLQKTVDVHNTNTIATPPYKGVDIQTRLDDNRLRLTYIQGSLLICEYYSQTLGKDEEAGSHSQSTPAFLQNYTRYKKFEMRVTSPISPSFDEATGEWGGTGTAMLYPGLKPNVGDQFITDMGDGRSGIFNVRTVKENSYFTNTTFEIEFELKGYLTKEKHEDLINKSVNTFVFVKDVLVYGESPYFTEERFDIRERYLKRLVLLRGDYYNKFVDGEEDIYVLPTKNQKIYDHEVAEILFKINDDTESPITNTLRRLTIDTGRTNPRVYTVWEMLLHLDRDYLPILDAKYKVVSRSIFKVPAYINSVYYSTVDKIVFPSRSIDKKYIGYNLSEDIAEGFHTGQLVLELGEVTTIEDVPTQPDIYPVNYDEYYVFSKHFYREEYDKMSSLEVLAWKMIKNEVVPDDKLTHLLNRYHFWGLLEQFYYLPVLMMLVKYNISKHN